jgi:hypothetical protein
MKKLSLFFFVLIFSIMYSCSKPESTSTATPPVVIKVTAEDSMRLGLIKIGQNFQGGIVAYILQPGDLGYDANIKHGLIAATSDQSKGIMWYNTSNANLSVTRTGATDTAIGTGLVNTNKIIASQGATSTNYAAGLARSYKGGGYSDWYLPSKNELNLLCKNIREVGNFPDQGYWSSTEINTNHNESASAWGQRFISNFVGSCTQGNTSKNVSLYVRAIRAF